MPILFALASGPFKGRWKLCEYYKNNKDEDFLTNEILRFKNKESDAMKAWARWSISLIQEKEIKFDYCIRALGHSETTASKSSPLHYLGTEISSAIGATFAWNILAKESVSPKFSGLGTLEKRVAAAEKIKYHINEEWKITKSKILLIDDLKTTGTTAKTIHEALSAKFKGIEVYHFTLGENQSDPNGKNDVKKEEAYKTYLGKK